MRRASERREWTHAKSGYVGCGDDRAEAKLHVELLQSCGIEAIARTLRHKYDGWPRAYRQWNYDYSTWSLWTRPQDAARAREIRRGFKVGLTLKGDPFDFITGVRAALQVRPKAKHGALPMTERPLLPDGSA